MNESENCGRKKATDAMRDRAKELEAQARSWRDLANRLDEIEKYALAENAKTEGDGPVPYIGVGSSAESFLWSLAAGYVK